MLEFSKVGNTAGSANVSGTPAIIRNIAPTILMGNNIRVIERIKST